MTNFQAFQRTYDDSHLYQQHPNHCAFLQLLYISGCWQHEDKELGYVQETHLWTARQDMSVQQGDELELDHS